MRRVLRDNGLSIVLFGLFFVFVIAQSVAGFFEYNSTEEQHGRPPIGYTAFLGSGDFIEAVFENWESEFLAIGAMVVLSIFLRQRHSPESKPVSASHRQTGG